MDARLASARTWADRFWAHEPDIDRAAEGLSRAASAAGAGVADAGVRARHRARRGYPRRHLRARAVAQGRAWRGRRGAAAHRRSGTAYLPPPGAVSGRRQFAGPAGPDPARVAGADLAMAGPRRRPGRLQGVRGGAGQPEAIRE